MLPEKCSVGGKNRWIEFSGVLRRGNMEVSLKLAKRRV